MNNEEYKGLSAAEFFYRNREIAGFSNPVRAVYQTIRELVENSLDATELYGILPRIKIEVSLDEADPNRVSVSIEDNGIGVPRNEVPQVFGRVFYGSKYVLRQSRGIFGLGVKMAVLYSQITTGKPIFVRSSTPSSTDIYEFELMIDISRNIPVIIKENVYRKTRFWHGTVVRLTLEGQWQGARRRVEEYIRRTAIIAPYAEIRFKSPEKELVFPRATKQLPKPPREGKPHPYGVDIELLKRMMKGAGDLSLKDFLARRFESVGEGIVSRFLEWAGIDGKRPVSSFKVSEIDKLARKMREFPKWRRPRPVTLSPLGEALLKKGVKAILKPEYVTAVTRRPSSYSGHPFVVEVAVAYSGEIPAQDRPLLYRFANKIPLLYDEGADVSRKIVDSVDWSYYKVSFPAPLAVIVHVCSTKVPFKGVGKEAIADVPEIEREIENALKEAARRLRSHISRMERVHAVARKKVGISKYIPEVARALSEICGTDAKVFEESLSKMLEKNILVTSELVKAKVVSE